MADTTDLRETTTRVEELALPRASAGLVVTVVLAAEAVAGLVALGVQDLAESRVDPLLATGAVVAAAVTALTLLVRSGRRAEPGNAWLAAAWTAIAATAGPIIGSLPTQITNNPAGPGTDRALVTVLGWSILLALALAGADRRPSARWSPWLVMAGLGALTAAAAAQAPQGSLLAPAGPTFVYGLLGGTALTLSFVTTLRWLRAWASHTGWARTWSGVGLILLTVAAALQLSGTEGSDRAWAAATALVLSALVVPGIGAGVAGLALAGARRMARRRLARELAGVSEVVDVTDSALEGPAGDPDDPVASLPMFTSLDVQIATVVNLATREASGALATAHLPGTGLDLDWWRSQAASMGLAEKFEVVLASRALDAARRENADAWLLLPIAASGVSPALMDLLSGSRAGHLVAVLSGGGRSASRVLAELRERGVNTGMLVSRVDSRLIEAVRTAQPSLLMIDGAIVASVATDGNAHGAVADIMAFAESNSLAVMAAGVSDPMGLAVLRELGVRYASGDAVVATGPAAAPAPGQVQAAAMDLIEAAGLRQRAD